MSRGSGRRLCVAGALERPDSRKCCRGGDRTETDERCRRAHCTLSLHTRLDGPLTRLRRDFLRVVVHCYAEYAAEASRLQARDAVLRAVTRRSGTATAKDALKCVRTKPPRCYMRSLSTRISAKWRSESDGGNNCGRRGERHRDRRWMRGFQAIVANRTSRRE